jgi:hypothetical protein
MAELKPCPFCGGRPYFKTEVFPNRKGKEGCYIIVCENCFATIAYHEPETLKWMWNRRADNEQVRL